MKGLETTDFDRELIANEFKFMDQNGDGVLDWWEFVNHESKIYLATRSKVSGNALITVV